jgi:hypothetical protein
MKRRIAIFAAPIMSLMFSVSSFGAPIISDTSAVQSGPQDGTSVYIAGQTYAEATSTSNAAVVINTTKPVPWSTNFLSGAVANWISFTNEASPTDLDGNSIGAGINDGEFVDVFKFFTLANASVFTLEIMADDRADVYLLSSSGVSALITSVYNPGLYCNATAPSCTNTFQGNYSNTLAAGNYVIGARIYQDNGTGFGVAYNATLADVPEPGSYALISLGLGGLLIAFKRRQKGTEN